MEVLTKAAPPTLWCGHTGRGVQFELTTTKTHAHTQQRGPRQRPPWTGRSEQQAGRRCRENGGLVVMGTKEKQHSRQRGCKLDVTQIQLVSPRQPTPKLTLKPHPSSCTACKHTHIFSLEFNLVSFIRVQGGRCCNLCLVWVTNLPR